MRRWGQKFHPYACAAIASFPQVHDAAFLLFLGFRVDQHQHFAIVDLVPEVQQAAMGADHQGFAGLFELSTFVATPLCLEPHFVENALAAALCSLSKFGHGLMMAA